MPNPVADPFSALARLTGTRLAHRLVRLTMTAACLGFLLLRLSEYQHFRHKTLWAAESAIFLVLILAYATRPEPVARAKGAWEVWLPLAVAALPFALLRSPAHPWVLENETARAATFLTMTAGTLLTVWGMRALGGAFSITVEARKVVAHGPYKIVRHPIYTGEIITATAVALWRFSTINLIVWALIVAGQLVRAKLEEKKLVKNFPEYQNVLDKSPWLW
jgi:protein-S-isoprenylcysteine O-methyltransferase Ste14